MERWDANATLHHGIGPPVPPVLPNASVLVSLQPGGEGLVDVLKVIPLEGPPPVPLQPQTSPPTIPTALVVAQQHAPLNPFDMYQLSQSQDAVGLGGGGGSPQLDHQPAANPLPTGSAGSGGGGGGGDGSDSGGGSVLAPPLTMDELMQSSIAPMGSSAKDVREVRATDTSSSSLLSTTLSGGSSGQQQQQQQQQHQHQQQQQNEGQEEPRPPPNLSESVPMFSTARGKLQVPSASSLSRAQAIWNDEGGGGGTGVKGTAFGSGSGSGSNSSSGSGSSVSSGAVASLSKFPLVRGKPNAPVAEAEAAVAAAFVPSMFSSGGGKAVVVSKQALERSRAMLDETELEGGGTTSAVVAPAFVPSMFSSGGGKAVVVSKQALERSRALLDETELEGGVGTALKPSHPPPPPPQAPSLSRPTTAQRGSGFPTPFGGGGAPSAGGGKGGQQQSKGFKPPQRVLQQQQQQQPTPQPFGSASFIGGGGAGGGGNGLSSSTLTTQLDTPFAASSVHFQFSGGGGGNASRPLLTSLLKAHPRPLPHVRNPSSPPPLAQCVMACTALPPGVQRQQQQQQQQGSASPLLVDCPQHAPSLPPLALPLPCSHPTNPSTPLRSITPSNATYVFFDAWGRPQLPHSGGDSPPLYPPGHPPHSPFIHPYSLATPSVLRAHSLLLGAGADPTLATPAWTCNAYRWVVSKLGEYEDKGGAMALARMGRRVGAATSTTTNNNTATTTTPPPPKHTLSGLLCWDAVVARLAGRYKREFFQGYKSPLTRVYAGDAPPSTHMLLKVASVSSRAPFTLELSDGWCSIGGLPCDSHVSNLVAQGVIKVGSVLRVACCDLVMAVGAPSTATTATAPAPASAAPFKGGKGGAGSLDIPSGFAPSPPPQAHLESTWNSPHPRAALWALMGIEPSTTTATPFSHHPHKGRPWAQWLGGGEGEEEEEGVSPTPLNTSQHPPPYHALPHSRYLTLRYNSVRPAPWYSRLGAPSTPHFLVPLSSLRPGGGPIPAVQGVLSRRRACKYLVGGVGGKVAMDGVEASAAVDAARRGVGEELESGLKALAAAHEAALKEVGRRAKAARVAAKANPPQPPAGLAKPSGSSSSSKVGGGMQVEEEEKEGAEEGEGGKKDDGSTPLDEDSPIPPSLSQSDLTGLPWGENDSGLVKAEAEEAAKLALQRSYAASHAALIESYGRGGSNSSSFGGGGGGGGGDNQPTSVPFTTLLLYDAHPAHAAVKAGCLRGAATSAATIMAKSMGPPLPFTPMSCAEVTLWRVSEEGASNYLEGQVYTVCGLSMGGGGGGGSGGGGGGGGSMTTPVIRLASSKETFFREVGLPWKEGVMEALFSPHILSAALDPTSITTFPTSLQLEPSTLAMAACGYSPRSRVLIAHAPAVSQGDATLAYTAQRLLALAAEHVLTTAATAATVAATTTTTAAVPTLPAPVGGGGGEAAGVVVVRSERDTDGFLMPTPRHPNRGGVVGAGGGRKGVTFAPSATLPPMACLLSFLSQPFYPTLTPQGLTLWRVLCSTTPATPTPPPHLPIPMARRVFLPTTPSTTFTPSTLVEGEVDLVVFVLAVSPARLQGGFAGPSSSSSAAASASSSSTALAGHIPNPTVEWEVYVTDESGAVGQCLFTTPLSTRTCYSGLTWEGSPPGVPLSPPPAASAPPLTPGSITTLLDIKYLHYGAMEGVHYLKWVAGSSIQTLTGGGKSGPSASSMASSSASASSSSSSRRLSMGVKGGGWIAPRVLLQNWLKQGWGGAPSAGEGGEEEEGEGEEEGEKEEGMKGEKAPLPPPPPSIPPTLLSLYTTTLHLPAITLPPALYSPPGMEVVTSLRGLLAQNHQLPPPLIPLLLLHKAATTSAGNSLATHAAATTTTNTTTNTSGPLPPSSFDTSSSSSSSSSNPSVGGRKRDFQALTASDVNTATIPAPPLDHQRAPTRARVNGSGGGGGGGGASGALPAKFTCKVYSLMPTSSSSTLESTLSPVPPNSIPLVLQGKGGGAQQAVPSSHPGLSPPTIYTLFPCKAGGGGGSSISSNPFPTLPPLAIPIPPIATAAAASSASSSFTATTIPAPQQHSPFISFTLEAPPTTYPPTHLLTTSPAPDVCAHTPGIKSGQGLLPLGPPLPSHASAHPRFLLSLRLPLLVTPGGGEEGSGVLLFANLPPPVAMNYLLSLLTRAAGGGVLKELEEALGCPALVAGEGGAPPAAAAAAAASMSLATPRMAALSSLLSTPSLNPTTLPLVLRCLAHTLLFSSLKSTTTPTPVCAVCDAARPHSQRIPLTRGEWDRVCTAFTALILAYPRVQMSAGVKTLPQQPTSGGGGVVGGGGGVVGSTTSKVAVGEGGGGDWRSEKDWKAAVALEESAWRAWEPQWEVTFAQVL